MKLIVGGAYQGKLDFAKTAYKITDEDVFICTDKTIDFSKKCIANLEEFTYACVQDETDPVACFKNHKEQWKDSILICQDISCGVVPLGADLRTWRRYTGLLCQYLACEAESVSRIFCGLEQKLK